MRIRLMLPSMVVGLTVLSAAGLAPADPGVGPAVIVNTQSSPHAKLRSVPLDCVRWTEGFWAERSRQAHEVTLRKLWDLLADPAHGHVLDNMRLAAGLKQGEYAGTNWQDAWLYKWIESAACVYRLTGDEWIERRMDESIALIVAAQEDDGYIATQITARGKPRFTDPREHEVYVMGHLLTAGCVHHRMTGKDSLLDVAIRNADFLCNTLGRSVPPCFAHNPSAVMGLVELYRETSERKYLGCAKMIVDRRGERPKRGGLFYQGPGIAGTDLIQDRVPLRREHEVVGHNVFFTYLYAGATDVFLEDGDRSLQPPLARLWADLTERKMCINGGVSPMGRGISKRADPVCEAVGPPYHLPCADSYNETCGQIGNFMWNYRMLSVDGDARFADLMERELYNGFLAGVSLEGDRWFYRNSLRRYDREHVEEGHNDMAERGLPGRKRICCPTNLLRTIVELPSYLYSTDDAGLWIHHYGGNTFDGRLADGSRVKLTQITDYPWDGKIEIRFDTVGTEKPFAVRVRIPGWAEGATVDVTGLPAANMPTPGQFLHIKRRWQTGDAIEIDLPMSPRLMQAHPKAEQLRNQVAVMRGPMLYCLESADLHEDVDVSNVYVPSDITLRPSPANDLPFGAVVLEGTALKRAEPAWTDQLYRRLEPRPLEPLSLRLIPYFAWANRGPSAMSVWLPVILRQ